MHLIKPLYIAEKHKKSRNFEHFQLENLKSSTLQDKSKTHTPKFRQIDAALYILDTCMHWIHTCVTTNTQNSYPFYANHAPSAHLKTIQEEFSQSNCRCKNLNQFEAVLVSAEFMKNLKFPTFGTSNANFQKIFIFSGSLDPQDHFGTNGSRIHPVLTKKSIAPRKWLYQFNFYCILIYMIH